MTHTSSTSLLMIIPPLTLPALALHSRDIPKDLGADLPDAIMFGDHLTLDQCERLVHQLGKTRFPFMCAHGRPSMVPLTTIAGMADNGKRTIDWRAWQGTMR